jgi:hypothetical protein
MKNGRKHMARASFTVGTRYMYAFKGLVRVAKRFQQNKGIVQVFFVCHCPNPRKHRQPVVQVGYSGIIFVGHRRFYSCLLFMVCRLFIIFCLLFIIWFGCCFAISHKILRGVVGGGW